MVHKTPWRLEHLEYDFSVYCGETSPWYIAVDSSPGKPAGELRSAPSGPGDWYHGSLIKKTGKKWCWLHSPFAWT